VIRKYHIQDARMSLASALLKRLFVSRILGIPWREAKFARKGDPTHGKPCVLSPDGRIMQHVDFNISHQAGLVALVGVDARHLAQSDMNEEPKAIEVGVDITCVNERGDYRKIDEEDFASFVDIYNEVFSFEELWDMKYNVDSFQLLDGTEITPEELGRHDRCVTRDRQLEVTVKSGQKITFSSELLIDAKLRRFYTFWAYKEAYIKLSGEALLAPWLRELEFKHVRSPKAGTVARCSTHGTWGEKVDDAEIWLRGQRLDDVVLEIQAYEEDRMIAVAAAPRIQFTPFHKIDVESEIMDFAINHA
jgi:4'-phosphopantetheinyl transferase